MDVTKAVPELRASARKAFMDMGWAETSAEGIVGVIADSYIGDLRWEAEQPEADLNDSYAMVAHQVAEGAASHFFGGIPDVVEPLRLFLVGVGAAYVSDPAENL